MYKKHLMFSLKSYHDCILQAIFSVFHDQKSVPSMYYYHSNSSKKSKTLFYIFRLNLKCSCQKNYISLAPDIHSIISYSSILLMHTLLTQFTCQLYQLRYHISIIVSMWKKPIDNLSINFGIHWILSLLVRETVDIGSHSCNIHTRNSDNLFSNLIAFV